MSFTQSKNSWRGPGLGKLGGAEPDEPAFRSSISMAAALSGVATSLISCSEWRPKSSGRRRRDRPPLTRMDYTTRGTEYSDRRVRNICASRGPTASQISRSLDEGLQQDNLDIGKSSRAS